MEAGPRPLGPCPFCGATDWSNDIQRGGEVQTECLTCGAEVTGYADTLHEAKAGTGATITIDNAGTAEPMVVPVYTEVWLA